MRTPKLRLVFDGSDKSSTGIIEWKVPDSGKSNDASAAAFVAGLEDWVFSAVPVIWRALASLRMHISEKSKECGEKSMGNTGRW